MGDDLNWTHAYILNTPEPRPSTSRRNPAWARDEAASSSRLVRVPGARGTPTYNNNNLSVIAAIGGAERGGRGQTSRFGGSVTPGPTPAPAREQFLRRLEKR